MIRLWFAPRTRAVRVRWVLEELGLPYALERVAFNVPARAFAQDTPLGKLPVLGDDFPNLASYMTRLEARPALQRSLE